MWLDEINPYIRKAKKAQMGYPLAVTERILLDYAITYIETGACEIGINGQWRLCEKGDIILLTPDSPHSIRNVENVKVGSSYISFDMKYDIYSESRKLNYHQVREDMSQELQMQISENIFIDKQIQFFKASDYPRFEKVFYDIIKNFKENSSETERLHCKGRICELLAMLLFDRTDNIARSEEATIKNVKQYIEENYTKGITLENLCERFYLNKFTLIRRFKSMYAISVIQYVNMLKLRRAKELLKDEDMTISEISAYLGFTTVFAFSKYFKNRMQISPKNYRDRHRSKKVKTDVNKR